MRFVLSSIASAVFVTAAFAAGATAPASFLVTNDDVGAVLNSNTATFYTIGATGALTMNASVATGGSGVAGGYFAANRILVAPPGQPDCLYVSDAQSEDIAGILLPGQTVTGNFQASATDTATTNGIGLAANANYLYASYTGSSTIATFQVQTGCALAFAGDILAVGLNGGLISGMALYNNMMIATYGDGSIESFDISAGVPVSNNDAQNATGLQKDHLPNGIDITQDGHYAIFGDASPFANVEVSDISSGKLTPTVAYTVGKAWNSGNVRLSPDETVLYIADSSGGRVTAAFFDKTTGAVTKGCTSPPLGGFYSKFSYAGELALQLNTGAGGLIYVPEFGSGSKSFIGVLQFTSTGTSCTLTEAAGSPVAGAPNSALLSIGVYPPRAF